MMQLQLETQNSSPREMAALPISPGKRETGFTAPPVLSPRTEIERRIYACVDHPNSTFDELQTLYREARESEFNTYVRIDWGTMTIMIHTRWPNGMRKLIGD